MKQPRSGTHPALETRARGLLVGVCAEADALDPLLAVLAPVEGDDVTVLVCLAPGAGDGAEALVERLARVALLPVSIAEPGRIEPGRIMVVPDDRVAVVTDSGLGLDPAPSTTERSGRFDPLLGSIAEQARQNAIAVVLPGSQGAEIGTGLAAVKRNGGRIIVAHTDPGLSTGDHAGLGIGEGVLPPARVAAFIAAHRHGLGGSDAPDRNLARRVAEQRQAAAQLGEMLESAQIPLAYVDGGLVLRRFTPALAELFDLTEEDVGQPLDRLARRAASPNLTKDVQRVIRTLGSFERPVARPGGGTPLLARVRPFRTLDGFIAGAVIVFAEPVAAPVAEQPREALLREIADSFDLFLFTGTTELLWESINARFAAYAGLGESAAAGEGWLLALHPDDLTSLRRRWHAAAAEAEPFDLELRIRAAAGDYRWFLCRAIPQRADDGTVTGWHGTCADIHERKLADDRLRLIMAERQHRVKNILAVVRSIFERTVGTSRDMEEAASHIVGRLDALARTQSVLVRTPEGGVDLEELVMGELLSHGGRDGERIGVCGPAVRLRAVAAEPFGMLVHELAMNAAKYGALSAPGGRLSVSWRIYDSGPGPRLGWEWREAGVTVIDPAPKRTGFGRELIESGLPYQLGATSSLEFLPGGIRCSVEIPLTERNSFMLATGS